MKLLTEGNEERNLRNYEQRAELKERLEKLV